VTGFLDLSVAASAPPPAPPKPPVAVPPPPPPVPRADPNRIYTMEDKDVTPPVVVRQEMPRLTPSMTMQARERGIVEVVIDEQGRVTNVAVRASVHPMFDAELLAAGRDWRYQPATLSGKPVRYRKMIQINVSRQE
jgi:TonB family protein